VEVLDEEVIEVLEEMEVVVLDITGLRDLSEVEVRVVSFLHWWFSTFGSRQL